MSEAPSGAPLDGGSVRLRPATRDDLPTLAVIRRTPEVYRHWRGSNDLMAAVAEDLDLLAEELSE